MKVTLVELRKEQRINIEFVEEGKKKGFEREKLDKAG